MTDRRQHKVENTRTIAALRAEVQALRAIIADVHALALEGLVYPASLVLDIIAAAERAPDKGQA